MGQEKIIIGFDFDGVIIDHTKARIKKPQQNGRGNYVNLSTKNIAFKAGGC